MPRDPGGSYFLPAGNPVIPETIIESDWANPTMSDIAQEMSDSLSRSGKGGMLAALRGPDGTAAVPTFSFTNEPTTGRFRDGPGQIVEAVNGVPVVRYLSSGLEQWDDNIMDWVPLTPRDALGTPFDPNPTNLTSTNVQDAIEEVNAKTGGVLSADNVTYDDTAVYFPATTVQQAIDRLGADLPDLAVDIANNADAIAINEINIASNTSRIETNEINIGNNTTNIGLLTTQVNANTGAIDDNTGEIGSIKLEQQTQNSRLGDLEFVQGQQQGQIEDNSDDISSNLGKINTNTSDINTLDNRLDGYDAAFPGGVLRVQNGGTGVTSSTGTGSTVRNTDPIFLGNPTVPTPGPSDNDQTIANTEWVMDRIAAAGGNNNITRGSNASGNWIRIPTEGTTTSADVVIQWGRKFTNSCAQVVTLPISVSGASAERVAVGSYESAGSCGVEKSVGVTSYTSTGFTLGATNGFYVRWVHYGLKA